jgi:DNA-binding transcriptional ArsR family regulator
MLDPRRSPLDAVFHALADPTRRAMLARLSEGERTVSELAAPFAMSLPGASKHLKVLEMAGLIERRIAGRTHYCSLRATRLAEADRWLAPYARHASTRVEASLHAEDAPAPSVREMRASLVELSRRYSRAAHEVEDLAHDIIVSALRREIPIDGEVFLRGLRGAARRHGAFLARSAVRRRAREASAAIQDGAEIHSADEHAEGAPLSVLSPPLRTTLFLLLSGLEKAELRYALGLSDAALRKRFQALRAHGPLVRPERASPRPARSELRRSQVRLLPRLPVAIEGNQAPRIVAASDPEGHGLIFTEVLTPGRRAATPEASAANERTLTEGHSC